MQIARGKAEPNRSVCVEWMLSDTIQSMRAIDEILTSDLVDGFCTLLQMQTAPERTAIKNLGPYLERREIDFGRPYVFTEDAVDLVIELTGFEVLYNAYSLWRKFTHHS
jgi:hypothetical protein